MKLIANSWGFRYGTEEHVPGENFPITVASTMGGLEFLEDSFKKNLNMRLEMRGEPQTSLHDVFARTRPKPDQLVYYASQQQIPFMEFYRGLSSYSEGMWNRYLAFSDRLEGSWNEIIEEGLGDEFEEHKGFAEFFLKHQEALISDLEVVMTTIFRMEEAIVLPFFEDGYVICSEQEFNRLLKKSRQYLMKYV